MLWQQDFSAPKLFGAKQSLRQMIGAQTSWRQNFSAPILLSANTPVKKCLRQNVILHTRWLSLFTQVLQELRIENPYLDNTLADNLGIQTTNSGFSKIYFDKIHEQNKKTTKGRSGYKDLVNGKNEPFLRNIEVCSEKVQDILVGVDENVRATKYREELFQFCKTVLNLCNSYNDHKSNFS